MRAWNELGDVVSVVISPCSSSQSHSNLTWELGERQTYGTANPKIGLVHGSVPPKEPADLEKVVPGTLIVI